MPPRPGGAIGDLSNDDYVAKVLASEARDNSLKYPSEGLGAYMPKKLSGAAPKPNTRFLRHIIKETDNHNTALKRKEEREARDRIRQLRDKTGSSSASHDTRRRHHQSGERDTERERKEDRERRHRSHRRRHRSHSASPDRSRRHRRRHDDDYDRHRRPRRDRRRDRDDDDERGYSRRHRSYTSSRSRSPRDERSSRRRNPRLSRSRSRSRSRSPGLSENRRYKEDGKSRDGYRSFREHRSSHRRHLKEPSPPQTTLPSHQPPEDDSDPLEDLVGPLPNKGGGNDGAAPIRSRGRGAYKPNTSNIDSHFAKDYDPILDVHLDDDDPSGSKSTRRPVPGLMTGDDDWELALEALRDRAHWKQKGEERLRQAGFSEDTVEKWKSNSAFTGAGSGAGAEARDMEGRIEDVKWSKRGEGREWDRGKVFDENGHVDVKASW